MTADGPELVQCRYCGRRVDVDLADGRVCPVCRDRTWCRQVRYAQQEVDRIEDAREGGETEE